MSVVVVYDPSRRGDVAKKYNINNPIAFNVPFFAVGNVIICNISMAHLTVAKEIADASGSTLEIFSEEKQKVRSKLPKKKSALEIEVDKKLNSLEKIPHGTYPSFMRYIGTKMYLSEMTNSDRYTPDDVRDVNVKAIFDLDHIVEAEGTMKAIYDYLETPKTDEEIAKIVDRYSKDNILWWMFQTIYKKRVNPKHVMNRDENFYDFTFIG